MRVKMGFLPLKCQRPINRLKADTPVWTVSMNTMEPKTKTNVADKMVYCYSAARE